MELGFDTVGFQKLFQRRPRGLQERSRLSHGSIHAIVDQGLVLDVFCDSEDLQSWIGAQSQDIEKNFTNREIYFYDEAQFEAALEKSLSGQTYFQQMELMRNHLKAIPAEGEKEGRGFELHEHFLVDSLRGGWNRVLPSSYGLFVRVTQSVPVTENYDFVLIVKRGELAAFHRPDFSFLSSERKGSTADLVSYLSEKYLVPIQGLFVQQEDWLQWMETSTPWRQLAESVRSDRAKLVPFRWSVMTLIATRAFLRL